jgi:hypothetical protein
MNIIRLFLLLFLIWMIWRFFNKKNVVKIQKKPVTSTMIACKYCGLHIPAEEAICVGDASFCCKEHSQL